MLCPVPLYQVSVSIPQCPVDVSVGCECFTAALFLETWLIVLSQWVAGAKPEDLCLPNPRMNVSLKEPREETVLPKCSENLGDGVAFQDLGHIGVWLTVLEAGHPNQSDSMVG